MIRHLLHLPMDHYHMERGWQSFWAVDTALRRAGLTAEQLEWCYTEENYGHMVAVFEVRDASR